MDRTFLLADARPARETIYPAATRHREGLDIYVNRAPLVLDIADRRADNDREVAVTDTEIRAYLAERWSRSQPKEAALDYMANGIWEDRRENVREDRSRSPGETQGEAAQVRTAANDNTLARIARDIRRTVFGWRHAQAVGTFVDGRSEVLAAYDDLRERTRAEGDAVALGGAFQETLTRHAILLKQAETFRARPDDFASLLAERGGIARKDLDAFEELHARARRHRRAATMRHVHRMKKEVEQEAQQPKPELRQGELALEGGRAEAPRRADTVTRDTAGMRPPDRDAAPARHVDTVPPVEVEAGARESHNTRDAYEVLNQDWSRHVDTAERVGTHVIYVEGYQGLRWRMEELIQNPELGDRSRRTIARVLEQLDEATKARRTVEDYLSAVAGHLDHRRDVLEIVAVESNKTVPDLVSYDAWREEIVRLTGAGERILVDRETYGIHIDDIAPGDNRVERALSDIRDTLVRDGRRIPEVREQEGEREQAAPPETPEQRERQALEEAREFSLLRSAVYDAQTDDEARIAQQELDAYVEREAKKYETPGERERQTQKQSKGRGMSL